jgi:CRISPR/Cas system Type II protein with McrA/HNH and RuvC-like nuclease domain
MERRDIIRRALSAVLRNGGATSSSRRQFPDSNNLKESLFESQNGLCAICGNEIDRRRLGDGTYVNLDHVKPFSLGGLSTKDNAALAHAACNQSKGSKVF